MPGLSYAIRPISYFWRAIAVGSSLVILALAVAMFGQTIATRRHFARLQSGIDRLSHKVKQLQAAEERRFMRELRARTTKYGTVAETQPDPGDSSEEKAK
jgi:hypothetical protein